MIDVMHADCLRILISAKADLNKANQQGMNAVYMAARNGHDDVVGWARAHGCPGPSDAALDFMMFGDQFADQITAHFGVPDGAIPIPIHLPIAAMDALDGPGGLGQHIATAVAAAAAGEAGPVALGPPNCAIM